MRYNQKIFVFLILQMGLF